MMKMTSKVFLCGAVAAAAMQTAAANAMDDVRIYGPVADRMNACIANHVRATDPMYFAREFRYPAEPGAWQTEFWGKYMLSAVPFAYYTHDEALKAKIAASVKEVISNQEPDGYIGNYPKDRRAAGGWDLWGNKYTMLGLMTWHEYSGDKEALAAAERLARYVMGIFGPGKRNLNETGCWRGLPSCSMLEVIVKIYERTGNKDYLDFARYIVSQLDEGERSPQLIRSALAGVLPGARVTDPDPKKFWVLSSRKSYEMMSCYQGLLAWARITGDTRALEACVKTGADIAATEVNISGGASCHENWYGGASKQTDTYIYENETCVVTTWLRFCRELLVATSDPKWADEIEKTFYNAYLASQRPDGSHFVQYTSLSGRRHLGEDHSRLHTNCCNANGPRGYLAFLTALLTADQDAVMMNLYASGTASVVWPKTGEKISLETYTLYPKMDTVSIRYREREPKRFKLKLRIPSWSAATSVSVKSVGGSPQAVKGAKAGSYLAIDREWKCGDQIDVRFDFTPVGHRLNGCAAFTVGPLLLARDARFGRGDISEVLARWANVDKPQIFRTRTQDDCFYATFIGLFMTGVHTKNAGERYPSVIDFCDYASAGNTWGDDSSFRVWLPIEKTPESL